MSDVTTFTIPAGSLFALNAQLGQIASLQPPPPAGGKYLLAKLMQAVASEVPLYQQQKLELLRKHAPKDEKGEPILRMLDLGNGQSSVTIDPVDKAAFAAEDAELGRVPIVMPVRMLTHADIAGCPIPQGVYTLMLGLILKDEPPPEG